MRSYPYHVCKNGMKFSQHTSLKTALRRLIAACEHPKKIPGTVFTLLRNSDKARGYYGYTMRPKKKYWIKWETFNNGVHFIETEAVDL